MDKREEDILDDILDGEEGDDIIETEETEEIEEIVIPETLRGDPDDEDKPENEPETESESDEKNDETSADLSDFLDDNTEVDASDAIETAGPLDPDLDKALSAFSDDDSDDSDQKKNKDQEENQDEDKTAAQKKPKNLKLIRNIVLICLAAALVIGGGLFAFLQIDKISNGNIMTFEGKKISIEEFKFFLLITQSNNEVKEAAVENLVRSLVLEKAAKDKNIVLDQDGIDYVKWYADYIKNDMAQNGITMPNLSDERLEAIISANTVFYSKLMDKVAEESNYTVDEPAFAAEFASYLAGDRLLKYIITETEEKAREVKELLTSGSISPDDAVTTYSVYYEGEIEKIELSKIGLAEEDNANIMALKQSEFSDIIDLGGIYAIFIVATDKEAEDLFRQDYTYYAKQRLFEEAYASWKSEAKYKRNDKAFDTFDENAYFESLYGDH